MTDGHKVAGGDRLGKTIIFAKNQDHAEFIEQRFDLNYPEYAGHFARVITHSVTYAQSLIDDFSIKDKAPHIAISVDMLDTGIDVPEVVNLVFFKLVRAKTKFWQMIGRGTRLCPDLYGPGRGQEELLRLRLLPATSSTSARTCPAPRARCRSRWPSGSSRPASAWSPPSTRTRQPSRRRPRRSGDGETVRARPARRHRLVPAPGRGRHERRQLPGPPGPAVGRDLLRLGRLAAPDPGAGRRHRPPPGRAALGRARRRRGRQAVRPASCCASSSPASTATPSLFERLRKQVQDIAAALLGQTAIPSVKAQELLLDELAGDEWWVDVTLPMLELARRRVRALVRFVDKTKRAVVYSDFADELGEGTIVDLPGVTPGTNWERFRAKARAYLRDHEDHLALQRLRRNLQLTPEDLTALEAMLLESGAGTEADIARAREESHGLGLFVRSLVGLDREAATEAFDRYLSDTTFSANQLRFVKLIVEHLTANGVMEVARLYESPFTDNAPHGPDMHLHRGPGRRHRRHPRTRSATAPCPTSPSPEPTRTDSSRVEETERSQPKFAR